MFEAIIFVLILFVFIATFIFWCCEKKRDLDTRIIGGAFIAYCFISVFAQMYLLPILAINDWDKRISLQMQLTALVVGLTAAIIAFRNYRRKSGSELLADIVVKKHNNIWYISEIMMQNCKDKATFIFAIDLIVDGNRIRVKTYNKPHVLSAYQTDILEFLPVFKYENDLKLSEENITTSRIECVTESGVILVDQLNIDMKLAIEPYTKALRMPEKYYNANFTDKTKYVLTLKKGGMLSIRPILTYFEVSIQDDYLHLINHSDEFKIQAIEKIMITSDLLFKVNRGIDIHEELNEKYQSYLRHNGFHRYAIDVEYTIVSFVNLEFELLN